MLKSRNSSTQNNTNSHEYKKKVTFKKIVSANTFKRLLKKPPKISSGKVHTSISYWHQSVFGWLCIIKLTAPFNTLYLESITKSTDLLSLVWDPSLIVSNNEAEKHLNFNPVPNETLQEKIDKYITPYNNIKVVTKFMNFNEKEGNETTEASLGDKWKKISSLILNQDKHTLRSTLSNINDKLYKKVDKTLKQRNEFKSNAVKKRVKFASTASNSPTRRGRSSLNVAQATTPKLMTKRLSVPMNVFKEREKERLSPRK